MSNITVNTIQSKANQTPSGVVDGYVNFFSNKRYVVLCYLNMLWTVSFNINIERLTLFNFIVSSRDK